MDKVVFICPSFNIESNVDDLVGSLQSQTNPAWKCYVIDDISTDQTYEKLLKKTEGDDRFIVIKNSEKNCRWYCRNAVEMLFRNMANRNSF